MEELEIFNAQTQGYIANGLFQIAVIIGVFIVFRAARFARQNNIIAKGLVSLFSLIIGFFSLSVGSLRPQLEQLTALRLADAQAAGATLTANTQDYIGTEKFKVRLARCIRWPYKELGVVKVGVCVDVGICD